MFSYLFKNHSFVATISPSFQSQVNGVLLNVLAVFDLHAVRPLLLRVFVPLLIVSIFLNSLSYYILY